MIILKVTKKQGFTFSLEDLFAKITGVSNEPPSSALLGLRRLSTSFTQ